MTSRSSCVPRKEIFAIFFFYCKTHVLMPSHRSLIDKSRTGRHAIPATRPGNIIKTPIEHPCDSSIAVAGVNANPVNIGLVHQCLRKISQQESHQRPLFIFHDKTCLLEVKKQAFMDPASQIPATPPVNHHIEHSSIIRWFSVSYIHFSIPFGRINPIVKDENLCGNKFQLILSAGLDNHATFLALIRRGLRAGTGRCGTLRRGPPLPACRRRQSSRRRARPRAPGRSRSPRT